PRGRGAFGRGARSRRCCTGLKIHLTCEDDASPRRAGLAETTTVAPPTFHAASVARTASVYCPFRLGVHANAYGAAYFTSVSTPLTVSVTLPTPTSSVASATTLPPFVEIVTAGAARSGHAAVLPGRPVAASRIAASDDFGVPSA